MAATRDPSPAEIAAECLLIQATWTPAEKLKRLRVDLRPTFTSCDGRELEIDAATYNRHHEQRAELLERTR